MYVKKNLMLWVAVLALALPLLLVGTASAKYMGDGAVPNGAGGWKLPSDLVCIVGIHADGTMDVADGVTDRHTCQYLTKGTMNGGTAFDLSTMTTSAMCKSAGVAGNDGAMHAWATSICMKSGAGFSLAGLDRTQQMCQANGGTWVTTGVCAAQGAQFKGQNASGTPLAFGAKGTVAAAGTGFCYATMNTGIAAASCPTVLGTTTGTGTATSVANFGYNSSATTCTYSFGIAGPVTSALTKANGTTTAAGTVVDLSLNTTMGDCLAAGGSWANWIPSSTTAAIGTVTTAATFDLTRQAVNADDGCLHCHSNAAQYNGPAERFKDSYLKTGHKNMLRKVVGPSPWAGPDANGNLAVYTTDGTNAINFNNAGTATINVAGTDRQLYYVYGDWMIALPSVVYGTTAVGTIGATNGYSCYACHATGASDNTAAVPGVQSIGTPGYAGVEPGNSFPGINLGATNPKWDIEGINCSRCHNATVPSVTAAQIAASAFNTTAPTSGGMGALATGTGRNNLCFGCHQSIAKLWPAQGGSTAGTTQYDPTLIPTGINHGAAAGRDFNGHVLGNSFLNSVHARYAGVNSNTANGGIKLNSLGKFDLVDTNGTTEYNSTFRGYTCWQGTTTNSPAKTKADGTEIKDKATCEGLYGVGSWRADQDGSLAATSIQGTCTTCHDVHNSLFVAGQEGIRKECVDCHNNDDFIAAMNTAYPLLGFKKMDPAVMNHPQGPGTPFADSDPCAVCHMATQAKENGDQNSMPVHVWRISTDVNYNTFPTAAVFGATDATKNRNATTAPETYTKANGTIGTYANAVWVDLDLACGQCHGGSLGTGATHNGAMYKTKAQLAAQAVFMHSIPTPPVPGTCTEAVNTAPVAAHGAVTVAGYTVSFADASTDAEGIAAGGVTVNWGDGSTSTGNALSTFSHTYASMTKTYTIKHSVTDAGVPSVCKVGTTVGALASAEVFKQAITLQKYAVTVNILGGATNATVTLKVNGKHTKAVQMGINGSAVFNVPAGTYSISAWASGYNVNNGSTFVVAGATSQNVTLVAK